MRKQYLKSLRLVPDEAETTFILHQKRTCYNGIYPFKIFPNESFLPGESMKYDTETILEALHLALDKHPQKFGLVFLGIDDLSLSISVDDEVFSNEMLLLAVQD